MATSEIAELINKYKNMHTIKEVDFNDAWKTYASAETNISEITRCDGTYRVWSMPDGYCAYLALATVR
jgi:hypothetical protein